MAVKPLRIGVYIPSDLAEEVVKLMKEVGAESISKVVQEALRLYIVEHSWKTEGEVVGAIGILYDHEIEHVDENITDLQHKYLDTIVSSIHLHLDPRNCLLIVIIRGSSKTIKKFIEEVDRIKGVKMVRLMLMPKQ